MICQDRLGTLMMSVLRDDECLKSLAERIRNQTCRFVLCCFVLFCFVLCCVVLFCFVCCRAKDHVPSILTAFYPGELGGVAIVNTLLGTNQNHNETAFLRCHFCANKNDHYTKTGSGQT